MSSRSKVTSVDALESFRSNLIIYLSKARPALEEISSEVARTRGWLETDQRTHWQGQVRRRLKDLEQAKQDLFSAELANLREVTVAERAAVTKTKRALDEAEAKLTRIKKWNRDFSSQVEPLNKQLGRLQNVLGHDLPLAVADLAQTIKALHAYTEVQLPSTTIAAPAPSKDEKEPS